MVKVDDIFPLQDAVFEGMKVKIMACNHEMLTRGFGDYMQLPPESQRYNHGAKVLDFARKKLQEHEHPTLGVLSTNTRAISLYKRMGWRLNGVLTVHDPAQGAPFAVYCEELRMRFHG